jgi:hypothetical protein
LDGLFFFIIFANKSDTMSELTNPTPTNVSTYTDDNIITLEGLEHVRLRPGMYIGKLGDGSSADDGIYVLLKEVVDNSIDEFRMKCGNTIEISIKEHTVSVRDYGRGIPQGKLVDCVSIMNTGAKYDTKSFQKSVGLNGVGTKAVNALSSTFTAISYRDGMAKRADFKEGKLVKEYDLEPTTEKNGTSSTGLIFSSGTMAQKFGSAISGSLVAILLGIAGFISGSDPATGETIITISDQDQEAVKEMIWMLFSIIPAFIVLIMMFLLHKYPIKK